MSNKKKATTSTPKSELVHFAVDWVTKDIEKGLREIDELPDGHRKRWLLAVKKNKEDSEVLMGELRHYYPGLEWPEQLPSHVDRYDDVVPILLHWLPRIDNPDIRASIAKAVGQRWLGRVAVDAVAECIAATLRDYPPSGPRDGDIQSMINALIRAADSDDLIRVAEVGLDPEMPDLPKSLLIFMLGRRRSAASAAALIALTENAKDHHLVEITNELLKNRSDTARTYVDGLKQHPIAAVRELAISGRFTKS